MALVSETRRVQAVRAAISRAAHVDFRVALAMREGLTSSAAEARAWRAAIDAMLWFAGLPCEQDPCEGAYAEGVGMQARFSMPFDVVYHTGSNSLFVLDAGNEVIRRIR